MDKKELEDRIALKELVDRVSILADQKDFQAQVQLFTVDAVSETIAGGETILNLKGRQEMAAAFADFNKNFDTSYHLNGQQVVSLNGGNATGTCYCLVTLISTENGKTTNTTFGAIYQDNYVRQDNRWLIATRIGNFRWEEKRTALINEF